jgi:hypothetical protein
MNFEINNKLLDEILQYCSYNNITDINQEINKYIRTGFNCERFGRTPFKTPNNANKDAENEHNRVDVEQITEINNAQPIKKNSKTIKIIEND